MAALAAALTLLGGVSACGADGDDRPDRADRAERQKPRGQDGQDGEPDGGAEPVWKRCAAPVTAHGSAAERPGDRWQCADLTVPLDHGDPSRGTIDIALIRAKAKEPGRRIGSLLFNFGGPGGSGVASLPLSAGQYTALNSRYDLVGFDPRGVAESSAVVCRDSAATEAAHRIDHTPDTPEEEKTYLRTSRAFGAGCAERSGRVLPHVGTENAARDMDLIRRALGDEKLHYLGFSYGTELGAVYAHLFPSRVGRLVLDGVVDPSADFVGSARNQVIGFQRALENYFTDRGEDPREGTRRIVRLLERVDRTPLTTASDRPLTENLALIGIILPLYSEASWPRLTEALEAAEDGDGTALLALADAYNNRDDKGAYSPQDHAQRAISCADSKGRVTADEVRSRHLAGFTRVSPVFGPYLAWDLAGWCADWPVAGAWESPDVSAPGAAPILVVGTTGDSATPYEGARRMADALGEGVGVLLTNKGDTHGAYGTSQCTTRTVDKYLLEGEIPEDGKVCD
ncbi:alpha/beta hydrolase [Streptomyces clavuligerus]|nr:alpha/beta hydrolase [Streptomyces clavuligerus]ANW18268.1 peptidase [Streptomyces clavuligerus]AXU12831.1 alpha/beta hydrolase [Streptomyces clavuligerus]EDY48469.1 protease [Streptomyces clavuligerus]MBY6302746.1 alpha/beta fold hydrolase [Streptomyces clavuligerus]QCS05615.1 alpha/beta hydrolase [Streptomyces clavuligerus]